MDWTTPLSFIRDQLLRHRVWIAWAIGSLLALRLLSLSASCALDSSQTCSDWFRYGLLGPFRFQWVFKYKELLAGALAVGGGAFAYFAATATIAANENRAKLERSQRIQAAIAGVLKSQTDLMHALDQDDPIDDAVRLRVAASSENLCQVSFRSFGIMLINASRMERNIDALIKRSKSANIKNKDPIYVQKRNEILTDILLITSFFTNPARSDDPGDTEEGQLAGKDTIELIRSQGLPEPDPSEPLTAMFDFTR